MPAIQAISVERNELGNKIARSNLARRNRRTTATVRCWRASDGGSNRISSSNQAVPSSVGATCGLITAAIRAEGNPCRMARMAGVAMTVSPIRFGQNTAILMSLIGVRQDFAIRARTAAWSSGIKIS